MQHNFYDTPGGISAQVNRIKILDSRKRVIFFQAQLPYLAAEAVRLDQYGGEDPSCDTG